MPISEYEDLDALDLAKLVRTRQVSPKELLDEAVSRIEKYNPELNCVVHKFYDRAEEQIRRGLPDGRFTGVPFLLKDIGMDYEGTPHESGSRALSGNISKTTSPLVRRYLDAGLVILGKTSTSEFGMMGTVETGANGPTRNPWDKTRSSGGSSGGSAAAVARRIVPAAHSSDGGGSIRIPAAWCGLYGLKASRGRIASGTAGWEVMSSSHVVTRTVRDSAAFLDISHGNLPGDHYVAPPFTGSYLEASAQAPRRLRIGVMASLTDMEIAPEATAAALHAAQLCESLGHDVEPVSLPFEGGAIRKVHRVILAVGTHRTLRALKAQQGEAFSEHNFQKYTWETAELGSTISAQEYLDATNDIFRVSRAFAPYFAHYDAIITPTTGRKAMKLGLAHPEQTPFEEIHRQLLLSFPFTHIYNMTGQPAASLPLYWAEDGMPVGVQIATRYGEDDLLLQLSAQLEAADPWIAREPD